jgi:hypothetical protein
VDLILPLHRMDLHESAEQNLVTATFDFPGVAKEDIQIDVHRNRLTVAAETKRPEDINENGYAVRERRFGKWARTLQLPEGVKVCARVRFFASFLKCALTSFVFRRRTSRRPWTMASSLSPSQRLPQSRRLSALPSLNYTAILYRSPPLYPSTVYHLFGVHVA